MADHAGYVVGGAGNAANAKLDPGTLDGLITINDRNLADLEIPDFMQGTPFPRTNAATVASHDTIHKWLRYELQTAGFRDPYGGRVLTRSTDQAKMTECKILDASYDVDLAIAREYRKGGQAGWMNRELSRALQAAMIALEKQVFYGKAGADATGFEGLGDMDEYDGTNGLQTGSENEKTHRVISAGGGVGNVNSSCWVIRSGPDAVELITGRSGDIQVGEPTVQQTDAGGGAMYPKLYVPVQAWYALKVGSQVSSAVRICNIENSFDDDMLYSAIKLFEGGRQPTHVYMNRHTLELLRKSRTATTTSGEPPHRPTTTDGIPILISESLITTEAQVT